MLKALIDDTRKILKLYGLGAVLFFLGVGFIQWAHKMVAPSLQQELIVLAALGLGGIGFCIAMFAQCLLIIHRFKNMGKPDIPSSKEKNFKSS